ncbi:MAG: DUF4331 domain-containing protein [Actinobacteria bacterium]|nr:MAG: DUF4331 domain-containing protein [Actinomycetota bacterium]
MSSSAEIPTKSWRSRRRRWKTAAALGSLTALAAGAFAINGGPFASSASSHREAPLIAGDPRADNTDLYAFSSPDDPSTVTIISNWIPFEEPNGGPNFYDWADASTNTSYTIKIDNNGDAVPDLTYTWVFTTHVRDANQQFLYNTGVISSLTDPDLNVYQTYTLTVTDGASNTTVLLLDKQAAPSIVGPASTPDYGVLRSQATYALPGGGKTFAGQADDPFFADLRVFDLLYGGNLSEAGQDTLAGYNVNTIVLQVPKTVLALNGNATTNPAIGIWSTTDRNGTQVSRLGNPLVNEVVVPLALKDAFNGLDPVADAGIPAVVAKVNDPILPHVIQTVYGIPAPATPRNDLFEIFLTGIAANNGNNGPVAVNLNSQLANADVNPANFRPSEMLRLNMATPVAAAPSRLGVLAGDFQGFPNGRRLTDDVIDIAVQAVEGAVTNGIVAPLAKGDAVDRNDHAFSATFPYLAVPNVAAVNGGPAQPPRAPELVSTTPTRLLDTRAGARPAAGAVVKVQVAGTAGVPTGATSALLNLTAVNSEGDGFVTAYACDKTRPTASSLNPRAGAATTNLVAAPLAADGSVCLYTSLSTDLIADLAGFHPAGSSYVATNAERLLDTRGGTKPADGQTVTLKVTATGTAQVPADAKAAFLNLTTTNSAGTGFVTVYPCGSTQPLASSSNTAAGETRATLVAAKIGTNGSVCLYTKGSTDLIVDLQGYEPATSNYVPLVPERVLDSRPASQVGYSGLKPTAGQTVEVKVTGFGTSQIPTTAASVLLNLTSVDPDGSGFATVYPCGSPRPATSNLNYQSGAISNLVSAKVGDGGRVCIYTQTSTHLVADVNGYYPDGSIGVAG